MIYCTPLSITGSDNVKLQGKKINETSIERVTKVGRMTDVARMKVAKIFDEL